MTAAAGLRDAPIVAARTGLLIVDAQNGTCRAASREDAPYFFDRVNGIVIPNIATLLDAARAAPIEVIHTVIRSLTADGRDRSLDYKLSGFHFPPGSREAEVIDELRPAGDEIILSKTSSSLFNSTNFEYIARNIGLDCILVTGFLTDQCIDHTIRDGADRGFRMICVTDACGTKSAERHTRAIAAFRGYCRLMVTREVLGEIGADGAQADLSGSMSRGK
ncbi:MAG: cysteine hydrolase family protein [Parvibaculaceae bacterium]